MTDYIVSFLYALRVVENGKEKHEEMTFEKNLSLEFKPYVKMLMLFPKDDDEIQLEISSIVYDTSREKFILYCPTGSYYYPRTYYKTESDWNEQIAKAIALIEEQKKNKGFRFYSSRVHFGEEYVRDENGECKKDATGSYLKEESRNVIHEYESTKHSPKEYAEKIKDFFSMKERFEKIGFTVAKNDFNFSHIEAHDAL